MQQFMVMTISYLLRMYSKLMLMTGVDIPVPELQTAIHQPTILEISYIGELQYFSTMQLFCFNKATLLAGNTKGTSNLLAMNNFEIFMTLINGPDAIEKKEQVIAVLAILFPGYVAQFLPRSLFFNNVEKKHSFTLDEKNFDNLKAVLEDVSGLKNATSGSNGSFNPKGQKAAEIAAKLMKGRQRAAQNRGEGSSDGVLARYVSILTIGLNSMSLSECLNLTVYQLYDLIERYGLYISWDLDIKSRLAGGKPDSKPDDWMKNIH